MTLENLIGKGLEREPASRGEIIRLLDKIARSVTGKTWGISHIFVLKSACMGEGIR